MNTGRFLDGPELTVMHDHGNEQNLFDRLIPFAKNSRTHSEAQVAQIAGSMGAFGFVNPVTLEISASRAEAFSTKCRLSERRIPVHQERLARTRVRAGAPPLTREDRRSLGVNSPARLKRSINSGPILRFREPVDRASVQSREAVRSLQSDNR
jgi:hypothetical protein